MPDSIAQRRWPRVVAVAAVAVILTACGDAETPDTASPQAVDRAQTATTAQFEATELQGALTRGSSTVVDDIHVEFNVVRATPDLVRRTMEPSAFEKWQPESGSVFIVSGAVHSGSLPSDPLMFRLDRNDQLLDAGRSESQTLSPHHRVTVLRFDTAFDPGPVALESQDGSIRLTWDAIGSASTDADEGPVSTPRHLEAGDPQLVQVKATDAGRGYEPDTIVLEAGRPAIIQFINPTDTERHFHIMDLAPERVEWLTPYGTTEVDGQTVPAQSDGPIPEPDALINADRLPFHVCDSDLGFCELATNVHFHAPPGTSDAVAFTPEQAGAFLVTDPSNSAFRAQVVVD